MPPGSAASSEPRIPPVPTSGNPSQLQNYLDTTKGGLLKQANFYRTLAHHPQLLDGYLPFSDCFHPGVLPPRDRELVILRVATLCRSGYVAHQHRPLGIDAGLTHDEVARLTGEGMDGAAWNSHDRLLIRATDELIESHCVSDEAWELLSRDYSYRECLEFVFLVGRVAMAAGFVNSVRLPLTEGA